MFCIIVCHLVNDHNFGALLLSPRCSWWCMCVCGTSRTADESYDAVPSCSWRCMGSTTTTCTPHAHFTPISDPYDQDLLFKLRFSGNIEEEITRAGDYMTTIQAQCANLCAAMSVRVEVLLFRSGVIGHVSRPIADPTVEPQDFLRKCLKCGKVAYLRKNGCANPDCVTWLRINKSVLSHIGQRWKRRPWRLQYSHTMPTIQELNQAWRTDGSKKTTMYIDVLLFGYLRHLEKNRKFLGP